MTEIMRRRRILLGRKNKGLKQLKFGQVDNYGDVLSINATIVIPTSTKTKAEIQAAWGAAPNNLQSLVQALIDCGCGGGGVPFFDPGYTTGTLSTLSNYDIAIAAMPLSDIISGTASYGTGSNGKFMAYCDEDGNGIYGKPGACVGFRYNSSSFDIYNGGYINTLGISAYPGGSEVQIYLIFFTSDGYFCLIRPGYNRNNSAFVVKNLEQSAIIKTWYESLRNI